VEEMTKNCGDTVRVQRSASSTRSDAAGNVQYFESVTKTVIPSMVATSVHL